MKLEELLYRAWEKGRRRWPQVELPADIFVRHFIQLWRKVATEEELALRLERDTLDVEGMYLACACVYKIPKADQILEHEYFKKLRPLLRRLGLSEARVDEVLQMVRELLLMGTRESGPKLAGYTGSGRLMRWMETVAVRIVPKTGSSIPPMPGDSTLGALAWSGTDPELALIKSDYRREFRQALNDARATLSDRDHNLILFHYSHRMPTTQMGPIFGVDQSTISRRLKEARDKILRETKRLLKERLNLSSQEFESLMNIIWSNIDISLSQIFSDDEDKEKG
jgi:RNA polymerase sigma-70 factor